MSEPWCHRAIVPCLGVVKEDQVAGCSREIIRKSSELDDAAPPMADVSLMREGGRTGGGIDDGP
jgi:hypothetical protein